MQEGKLDQPGSRTAKGQWMSEAVKDERQDLYEVIKVDDVLVAALGSLRMSTKTTIACPSL